MIIMTASSSANPNPLDISFLKLCCRAGALETTRKTPPERAISDDIWLVEAQQISKFLQIREAIRGPHRCFRCRY